MSRLVEWLREFYQKHHQKSLAAAIEKAPGLPDWSPIQGVNFRTGMAPYFWQDSAGNYFYLADIPSPKVWKLANLEQVKVLSNHIAFDIGKIRLLTLAFTPMLLLFIVISVKMEVLINETTFFSLIFFLVLIAGSFLLKQTKNRKTIIDRLKLEPVNLTLPQNARWILYCKHYPEQRFKTFLFALATLIVLPAIIALPLLFANS